MHRLGQQPQIIVEETEEEEDADVATPLRPTDTFPYKRRNSPCYFRESDENMANLRAMHQEFGDVYAPSPTPSAASTVSRHEFASPSISDEMMKGMMHISTICERNKVCKTGKYVYTATMANYTVTEWLLENGEDHEKINKELQYLCSLRHKRLAPTYGFHWTGNVLYVFRTHVPTGTIADQLKRGALPQEQALRYTVQVIDALCYLHERSRVHGKLTASNLLITISNDILVSDPSVDGLPSSQKRRALLSSPPEAFRSFSDFPCLTSQADIWAVGCVLVAMVTRFPPFSDHFLHFHGEKLHKELIKEWHHNQLQFNSKCLTPTSTKDICELVDQLFVIRPENRPTAQSLFEVYGAKSRKTSMRASLTSLAGVAKVAAEEEKPANNTPLDHFYREREDDNAHAQLEMLIEKHEERLEARSESGFRPFLRWYLSRFIIFTILLIKWIGMVLCAAISLALVAGSVFLSIFIIYNGIEVVCQCRLNEGFIVLIALILLPIIILLFTLCCNNSLEKYHSDVESGKVEKSKYVMKTPEKDVIIGGYIIVEGKPGEENSRKHGISEGMAALTRGDFLSGVARIA